MKPPALPAARRACALAATLLLGCVDVVTITTGSDGGPADLGPEALHYVDTGPAPPGSGVMCAGVRCEPGAMCCLLTGRCFDPATDRASCARPPDAGNYGSMTDPGALPCISNADCAADEFCYVHMDHYDGCLGVGVCFGRDNAPSCGDGTTNILPVCEVCGCDGVTYRDQRAAWAAGVNAHGGPCGASFIAQDAGPNARSSPVPCGYDTECPSGSTCCAATGYCYDPSCPGCCQISPIGTAGPCEHNSDCPTDHPLCRGNTSACEGAGFCVEPEGNCGGSVAFVCGCDGHTYSNECWASQALTRVASPGVCPM